MKRIVGNDSTPVDEPRVMPAEAKASKELGRKNVASLHKAVLWYRSEKSNITGKIEIRRYFVGKVQVAYVEIFTKGSSGHGDATHIAHNINRGDGNAGHPFSSDADLHGFLCSVLETGL